MNHASSILTCHHNLNMCCAKQYQNYKMPVAVQSLVPLHSPAPFLPPAPRTGSTGCKTSPESAKELGARPDAPRPPPGNPALSSRKHESRNCSSCAVLVAPRNVLRTGVMLQINVLEKKRGRPSAPDEHAASTTGQIFPASAYCPAPRRNRH